MVRPLDQQVVVITGASSGIGKQTARRFAQAGARVVLAARRGELLEELAEELEGEGHVAFPVVTDVTDPLQLERLIEAAIDRFEFIDTWVNNAGAAVFGHFEQIPSEDFSRELEVILMSQINAIRQVLPVFRRQGCGTFVNIGSLFGRIPVPLFTPYVTAEFGLIGFTESLRQELEGSGIEVCLVVPAWVDTPFFDHARGAFGLKPKPADPVYDPDTVAQAILRCAAHPRRRVVVGWAARSMELAERLLPGFTRRRMASISPDLLDTRTPQPYVDALYSPTEQGREVRGGWGTTRERLWLLVRQNAPLLRAGVAALLIGGATALALKLRRNAQRRHAHTFHLPHLGTVRIPHRRHAHGAHPLTHFKDARNPLQARKRSWTSSGRSKGRALLKRIARRLVMAQMMNVLRSALWENGTAGARRASLDQRIREGAKRLARGAEAGSVNARSVHAAGQRADPGAPREVSPQGESRPGESRPGESRPGESRPGESRPGATHP